jgi:hypothetical protein
MPGFVFTFIPAYADSTWPETHGASRLQRFQQKDVSTRTGCINRVLRTTSPHARDAVMISFNPEVLSINLQRTGEFFMHSLWVQGQMVDLLILRKRPDIVEDLVKSAGRIPNEMFTLRSEYWTKDFDPIKNEFESTFDIDDPHKEDLDAILVLRNAIAHAHVSMGRQYFLYRPRDEKKEQKMISALKLERKIDESNPLTLKIAFNDDTYYMEQFARFQRLDADCFAPIANGIGIPHSRIR